MESPKLLDQVRQSIRLRHCSIRTEEAYGQHRQTLYSVSWQTSPARDGHGQDS